MGWPPNLAGRAERPSALTVSMGITSWATKMAASWVGIFELLNPGPEGDNFDTTLPEWLVVIPNLIQHRGEGREKGKRGILKGSSKMTGAGKKGTSFRVHAQPQDDCNFIIHMSAQVGTTGEPREFR